MCGVIPPGSLQSNRNLEITFPEKIVTVDLAPGPYALFRDDRAGSTRVFHAPREIIRANRADEILPALQRLEQARKEGFGLAGYLSYEAGHIFEEKLRHLIINDRETPLICMGVFDAPAGEEHALAQRSTGKENEAVLFDAQAEWDLEAYRTRFDTLHDHLRRGDCYQANLTMPVHARWSG